MKTKKRLKSIELFSGAGGLALGLEDSGFEHLALVERDQDSCNTLRQNKIFDGWQVFETDVRSFDHKRFSKEDVDLIAGGPPCQPFSLGGKHRAFQDDRDMFPEAVRSIREVRPKSFIFENVKGLMRPSFAKYFEYIILQLTYPELVKQPSEDWIDHLSRLENHHTKGKIKGLNYRVVYRVLNAADYGVPQRRERVVIVGFRNDLGIEWSFPAPTHSLESLIVDQKGKYWERHGIAKKDRQIPFGLSDENYGYDELARAEALLPWATVRDAIVDLPDPREKNKFRNHVFMPGARVYAGHTGSHIDFPSKTIKAGGHGVPGGENMILYPDGKVRYFTVREAARIQTFPDSYFINGSWSESMRQIGNAVPVKLAQVIGKSVVRELTSRG